MSSLMTEETAEAFRKLVRHELKAQNMKQFELAKAAGISKDALSKVMSRKNNPGAAIFTKVLMALGKTQEHLLLLEQRSSGPDVSDRERAAELGLTALNPLFRYIRDLELRLVSVELELDDLRGPKK